MTQTVARIPKPTAAALDAARAVAAEDSPLYCPAVRKTARLGFFCANLSHDAKKRFSHSDSFRFLPPKMG